MKRQNSGDLSVQLTKKQKLVTDDMDCKVTETTNNNDDIDSMSLPPIPYAVVCEHIVPHFSRTWLYVSKECHQIAFKYLLSDPRIDKKFATRPWVPLYLACQKGYIRIVQLLLTDPRVNPNDNHLWQVSLKHYDIFKLFINSPRASNELLKIHFIHAVEKCYYNEVIELLNDSRLDKCAQAIVGLKYATLCNHVSIVQYLLREFKDKIPIESWTEALKTAAKAGNNILTALLLEHGFDPTDECNHALRGAVANGHYVVVAQLLKCPQIDPMDDREIEVANYESQKLLGSAIEEALYNKDKTMIQILLNDSRVVLNDQLTQIYVDLLPQAHK